MPLRETAAEMGPAVTSWTLKSGVEGKGVYRNALAKCTSVVIQRLLYAPMSRRTVKMRLSSISKAWGELPLAQLSCPRFEDRQHKHPQGSDSAAEATY